MADGSVMVDTELDPQGFKAGSAEMKNAVKSLESQVKALGPALKRAAKGGSFKDYQAEADRAKASIAEMEKELEALGNKPVATDQYKDMIAGMDRATAKLEALEHKQDLLKKRGVSENSTQWKNLQIDIDEARAKAEQYAEAVANMESNGTAFTPGTETAEYATLASQIEQAKQALADLEAEAANAQAQLSQVPTASGMIKSAFASIGATVRGAFSGVANAVTHPIQTADRALGALLVKAGQLPGALAALGKASIGHLVSGLKTAASAIGKIITGGRSMGKQFSNMASMMQKFSLAALGARGIYSILRKAVSEYMSQNTQLSGQMSSMFSSLGNILGPIITRIIGLVSTAIGYITALLNLLGIAGSAAVKSIDKAAGGAGGAAKELKRQLAGFDDLNILNGQDEGGGGGGGSDATDFTEATLPDWVSLMVTKIKEGDWAGAATVLTDELNKMVDKVDWSGIGAKIGYWLNAALTFLATAILNFDWKNLGAHLAESVNAIITSVDWTNLGTVLSGKFRAILLTAAGFLENFDWAAFAQGFSDFAIGFFNGISSAIEAVDWKKIGEEIKTFLKNTDWAGIAEAIAEGIGAALGGLAALLWGLIEEAWDSVVEWWHDSAFEDGEFTIAGLLEGIGSAIAGVASWIKANIVDPFVNGFKAAFGIASPSTVMAEQGEFVGLGILQGIANVFKNIGAWIDENILQPIRDALELDGTENILEIGVKLVKKGWKTLKKFVGTAVTAAVSLAKKGWKSLKKWVGDKLDVAISLIKKGWKKIEKFVGDAVKVSISLLKKGWSTISNYVGTAVSVYISLLKRSWTTISNFVGTAVSVYISLLKKGWTSISNWIGTTNSVYISLLKRGWSTIAGFIGTSVSVGISLFKSGWSSLKAFFGLASGGIVTNHGFKLLSSGGVLHDGTTNWWRSIPKYATGTHTAHGSMFVAGEAGPEIVGHVNNRTEVLNKSQLAATMEAAVRTAMVTISNTIGSAILSRMTACANGIISAVLYAATTKPAVNVAPIEGSVGGGDVLAKLQEIASRITYSAPVVAGSVMPYSVAPGGADTSGIADVIEASNDELGSVIVQAVTNAASSIVNAIQQYSGGDTTFDSRYVADLTIKEINRRTRAVGQSPLLNT